MTKIKKQFTAIICSIIMLLGGFFSFGKTQAQAYNPFLTPEEIEDIRSDFIVEAITALGYSVNSTAPLIIFADIQILEGSFLEILADCVGDTSQSDPITALRNHNVYVLMHEGNAQFACLTSPESSITVYYDFSLPADAMILYDWLQNAWVCGMGIWQFHGNIHEFFGEVQYITLEYYGYEFPIFVIARDLIVPSEFGLIVYVYDIERGYFISIRQYIEENWG